MKLAAGKKVHYDSGPNMTPLVDVVMVILIFLMLTGTFAVGEHYLQTNIPVTKKGVSGAVAPNNALPPDEPLEIRVDSPNADEWYAQAGGYAVKGSREGLVNLLTKMRQQMGGNADKIQVIINPGRQTKYKHLVEVYECAMDAGCKKIAFSTAH